MIVGESSLFKDGTDHKKPTVEICHICVMKFNSLVKEIEAEVRGK